VRKILKNQSNTMVSAKTIDGIHKQVESSEKYLLVNYEFHMKTSLNGEINQTIRSTQQ
jgi:hypothetical protein